MQVKGKTERELKDMLWEHTKNFVKEQRISCSETVYQTDRVIVNGYEFIDGAAKIVGFHEEDD